MSVEIKTELIQLKVTAKTAKEINSYCKQNGVKRTEFIRSLVSAVVSNPMVVVDRGRVIVAKEVQIKNVETIKH